MHENELQHHGILGMKWGVRRFQNADGSLTSAGKRRYRREINKANFNYIKNTASAVKDVDRRQTQRYVEAYNRAADDFNAGLTEKYNKEYEERKGKNAGWADDPEYINNYNKQFDALMAKYYDDALIQELLNNPNYIKAQAIVSKYGVEKLHPNVRQYEQRLDELIELSKKGEFIPWNIEKN